MATERGTSDVSFDCLRLRSSPQFRPVVADAAPGAISPEPSRYSAQLLVFLRIAAFHTLSFDRSYMTWEAASHGLGFALESKRLAQNYLARETLVE